MVKVTFKLITTLLFLSGNLCYSQDKDENQHNNNPLKLELSLQNYEVTFDALDTLKYCLRFTSLLQDNLIIEVPQIMFYCGYPDDKFIDSDYYFEILFSEYGTTYKMYSYRKVIAYSNYNESPDFVVHLKAGDSHTYSCTDLTELYKLKNRGYYKIKCVTSKRFHSIESNEVLLRIK